MMVRRQPFPAILLPGFILLILVLAVGFRSAYRFFYRQAYPRTYIELVEANSAENGLDPMLVYAVIHTESGFRPGAQSNVDARGLMQLTEDTYKWAGYRLGENQEDLNFNELYDPEVNIKYGTVVLRLLLEEFGDEYTALAAYHAGWGSVKGWLDDEKYSSDGVRLDAIPFPTTSLYVPKVLETKQMYRQLYEEKGA